jgi:hypothetical protein
VAERRNRAGKQSLRLPEMPGQSTRRRRTWKSLVGVGLWGAATTLLAYVLSFGSLQLFLIFMLVIGLLVRLLAFGVARARGQELPRGWWL